MLPYGYHEYHSDRCAALASKGRRFFLQDPLPLLTKSKHHFFLITYAVSLCTHHNRTIRHTHYTNSIHQCHVQCSVHAQSCNSISERPSTAFRNAALPSSPSEFKLTSIFVSPLLTRSASASGFAPSAPIWLPRKFSCNRETMKQSSISQRCNQNWA